MTYDFRRVKGYLFTCTILRKGSAISSIRIAITIMAVIFLSACAKPSETVKEDGTDQTIDAEKSAVANEAKAIIDKAEPKKDSSATTKKDSEPKTLTKAAAKELASKQCLEDMQKLEGREADEIEKACAKAQIFDACYSVDGTPIYHYDALSSNQRGKRILVFALIHGDEGPSGSVARLWMERLNKIEPRNTWRVVPVLNPDGWRAKTRMNANKIDLNRNFPTENWKVESAARWKEKKHDPRRFPGKIPGSEPETQCAIEHIEDFNPSFIISIHTPYGVLDFDGPRMQFPDFKPLRWFSLGNYPGSMGRYMWAERRVPVLTIELKGNENIASKLEQFDHLQDISGTVAIQSERILKRQEKKRPQTLRSRAKSKSKTKSRASTTSRKKVATKSADQTKL